MTIVGRPMRVREASRRFNLPPGRIYSAINLGELEAYNIGTPRKPSFLLCEADIELWLRSLSTKKVE